MNFLASGENISIKEPPGEPRHPISSLSPQTSWLLLELSGVIEKKNPYGLQVGSNWKEV